MSMFIQLFLTLFVVGGVITNDSSIEMKRFQKREIVLFSLLSKDVTLHEPVIVDIAFDNILSEPITINLGADNKEGFRFSIKKPTSMKLDIPFRIKEGFARSGRITLQPGQTYRQRLIMNEWIIFSDLGKYELSVHLVAPVSTQKGQAVPVTRNFQAVLEVTPRDDKKLMSVCARFYGEFSASKSYERASEAISVISYIQDSVAVQYLEKALRSGKMVEPIAIGGLERIGTTEAVHALISALSMQASDINTSVRSALIRLELKSTDSVLKEKIKRVLN